MNPAMYSGIKYAVNHVGTDPDLAGRLTAGPAAYSSRVAIWAAANAIPFAVTAWAVRNLSRLPQQNPGSLKNESNEHVDAVGNNSPVLHIHRLLLDPGRPDTTQRLLGPSKACLHGILETGI